MQRRTVKPALILLLVLLGASTAGASSVAELHVGIHVDEGPLTPYGYTFGYPGLQLVRVIYDTLFVLDVDRQPQPWMVEDYQISADGLAWRFTLYPDIYFHDGQALTAYDVAFTYQYMAGHTHSTWRRATELVDAIEVLDETSFVFRLTEPQPLFMRRPLAEVPILPAHLWQEVEEPTEFADATGSGPYQLAEYRSGQFYRFEAHPDYFRPDYEPALERIIMPIIPDQTTLFSSLRTGDIAMATREIPPELVEEMERSSALALSRGPLFSSQLLLINNEEPYLDTVAFRRALALMVDTRYLVDTLRLGYGLRGSSGFVHPDSPWLQATLSPMTQDLDGARAILDELGFRDITQDGYREDPDGAPFSLSILAYAERPERVRTAEIIASWMQECGINTTVRAMEAGTVDALVWPDFDVAKGRDFQLATWGWSAGIQELPLSLREVLHSQGTLNVGAFSCPDMDAIADQLLGAKSEDDMRPVVTAMAEQAAQTLPFITLWYPESVYAYQTNAYDGWVFVTGLGVLDKWSLLASRTENGSEDTPAPVEPEDARDTFDPLIYVIAAIVLVAGVFMMQRRRQT